MKNEMFQELLGSVREAGAVLRGQKKPSRRLVISASALCGILANPTSDRERLTSEPPAQDRRSTDHQDDPNYQQHQKRRGVH